MKLLIGTKVKMKQKIAKWYLDHPDVYVGGGGVIDKDFDTEVQMHLSCCIGEPCIGVISGYGDNCYKVKWECGPFKAWYYTDRKHFTISK